MIEVLDSKIFNTECGEVAVDQLDGAVAFSAKFGNILLTRVEEVPDSELAFNATDAVIAVGAILYSLVDLKPFVDDTYQAMNNVSIN